MTPPPAALDDFAEFLTDAYAEWVTACEAHGWSPVFEWHPAGHVLVVYDVLSGPVVITDAGRPLPAAPADVDLWVLSSAVGTLRVAADATVNQWVAAIAGLLATGR